jgi:hypothetical protein
MRLICHWQQRQLAQRAVLKAPLSPRSALTNHLAHCSECAEAYQDMIRLQREVLERLPSCALSPDFDAGLLTRFTAEIQGVSPSQPFETRFRLRPLALAGAIAAVGAVGGLLWISNARTGVKDTTTKSGPRHEQPIRPDPRSMAFRSESQATVPETPPQTHHASMNNMGERPRRRRQHPYHRRYHREKPVRTLYASVRPMSASHQNQAQPRRDSATVVRTTCATTWRELGQVYEACGDYGRACLAYERAFTKQSDADVAIAAGETADRTGDPSRALTDLAQLLSEGSNGATPPDEPQER